MAQSPRGKPVTTLNFEAFSQLVCSVRSTCEEWLKGERDSDSLISEFNRISSRHWAIEGFYGLPDDFDWTSIPDSDRDQADKLSENFRNAVWMLSSAIKVEQELSESTELEHSSINKGLLLGRVWGTRDLNLKL